MTLPGKIKLMPQTVSGQPWQGVCYFCTTRLGGVSQGPWASLNLGRHTKDDPAQVEENRLRLMQRLPGAPWWLNQVHGTNVLDVDLPVRRGLAVPVVPPTADAAVTTRAGVVLAIMTADCLPVVIASTDGRALGVAHAGWRGLAAGVLERTLDALRTRAGMAAAWRAWIGPAISRRHFEVGDDVYRAFHAGNAGAEAHFVQGENGKWLADLPALAHDRLLQAGVQTIELSGECTFAQADRYYSYRRNSLTGRQATLAWLTSASDLP